MYLFLVINSFIYFYSDELPVQLTLPRALREAKNRQQLSSLALLGQEFWRYPMASPKPSTSTSPTTQLNSKTDSSGIGTTVFSNTNNNNRINSGNTNVTNINNNNGNCLNQPHYPSSNNNAKLFSPSNPSIGVISQAGTPSDTASSMSSFTSTGQQIMSPESVDSLMLTMSPVDNSHNGIVGKTSTFKVQNRKSMDLETIPSFVSSMPNSQFSGNISDNNNDNLPRNITRPTPPSTLNLAPLR